MNLPVPRILVVTSDSLAANFLGRRAENETRDFPGLDLAHEIRVLTTRLKTNQRIVSTLKDMVSQVWELPSGLVIDAFHLSPLIMRMWRHFPETVFARSVDLETNLNALRLVRDSEPRVLAIDLLALASWFSRSNRPCLLIVDKASLDNMDLTTGLPYELVNSPSFRFRFVIDADHENAIKEAVGSINSLQCLGGSRFSASAASNVKPFQCPSLSLLQNQWETETFDFDEVRDLISDVFGFDVVGEDETSESYHQAMGLRQVFLRCIALTCQMATTAFEQRSCNPKVLLTDTATLKGWLEKGLLSAFISFEGQQLTWFHKADPWLLQSGVEMALSERSVLAVDRKTGRVYGVYELVQIASTRFETLCNLTSECETTLAIAAIDPGYVEVFYRGDLILWFDRDRWHADPFRFLTSRLTALRIVRGLQLKILAAISLLMDSRESTILIFSSDDRESGIPDQYLNEMRPEIAFRGWISAEKNAKSVRRIRGKFAGQSLESITPHGLASLFRLDGAHVVRILNESREEATTSVLHLANVAELIEVNDTVRRRSGEKGRSQQGSGRQAAYRLSQKLRGFVLKVSASGRLYVFDGVGS